MGLIIFLWMTGSIAMARSPNLIVILTDDQGYADVGFNGCEDIPTPHMDSIAENGVCFREGYVSFPVCGPSRAGLLTGRYQDRFGFTTNPTIDPGNPMAGLPASEENIAEVLKKVGYRSAIVGKWHMGSHPVNHPLQRGFDYFYGFLSGGHNYFHDQLTLNDLSEVTRPWEWYRTRIMENHVRVDTDDYLTDELTDAAIAFVERQGAEQPFFVYLAYNAPHAPLQATEKYLARFSHIENDRRRTYAAMVSAVDDGVGRLLAALREQELDENTIVFFLSDNGGPIEKNASDNGVLRGAKSDLFEGGIRVPFAMQWKGVVPRGVNYPHPVISLDIMSTITALSGVKISEERPLDGVNLIPYVTGEKNGQPHQQLFWRKWQQQGMAIRAGNLKLVANTQMNKNVIECYDLAEDVSEMAPLGKRAETEAAKMKANWDAWNDTLKDCVFPTLMEDKWWKR
jgi:arylsulfatase A-like enzyme